MAGTLKYVMWLGVSGSLLLGCSSKPESDSRALTLPVQPEQAHVTDQVQVAGLDLVLWNQSGGCQLQLGKSPPSVWLKPMAPCHFIKSPGLNRVQVFRLDKTTQVVAVVGTPAKQWRCGQEVQGLVISGGQVTPSAHIMQGSVYCADQGLQNFQYGLFTKPLKP
ncbi:hypothetical protein [Candidatus Thiothrix anitrata]|uniref:Lipoprotein n=1 Tax=Candidatus Thiothrix anitrata TaxID=2823902 RepID=A0ABX7X5X9_9GAMM|nr:hypothetical protein [Candidatus Thiothrix anitrata]QTR50233.1 hypothetical protein J8380_01210 [Candidatus Thiothrix anitrata]